MGIDTEKLDRFTKAVDGEIDIEIEQILAEAHSSKEAIIAKANDKCLNIAYDKIKGEIKNISAKYIKQISQLELESQREVLMYREKLAAQVFHAVKMRLEEFSQTENYKTKLIQTISELLGESDDEAVVRISQKDMKYAQEIKSVLKGGQSINADKAIKLGGARIFFPKTNIMLDKTFDLAIVEQKEMFNQSASLRLG